MRLLSRWRSRSPASATPRCDPCSDIAGQQQPRARLVQAGDGPPPRAPSAPTANRPLTTSPARTSRRSATLVRCEIEMLRGFDCVQRIPSRSQYSQNSARMSADRFEKNHRGYAYSALRPLGSSVVKRLTVRQPSECSSPRRNSRGNRSTISRCQPASSILRSCLRPGPCCGKASGHLLLVSHHANAAPDGIGLRSHSARELHRSHRRDALVDQRRVGGVARDHQTTGARMVREMSVAEIQAEEVAVRARIRWPPQRRHEQMFAAGSDGIGDRLGVYNRLWFGSRGTGPTVRMAVSKTAGRGSIPWSPAQSRGNDRLAAARRRRPARAGSPLPTLISSREPVPYRPARLCISAEAARREPAFPGSASARSRRPSRSARTCTEQGCAGSRCGRLGSACPRVSRFPCLRTIGPNTAGREVAACSRTAFWTNV